MPMACRLQHASINADAIRDRVQIATQVPTDSSCRARRASGYRRMVDRPEFNPTWLDRRRR